MGYIQFHASTRNSDAFGEANNGAESPQEQLIGTEKFREKVANCTMYFNALKMN
ncbi:uncharacterized protein ASCRUDRAFT_78305 [Ascoidea rubescens DSM 1968]|uniref:Uncharacterized protein n=1 Tax=Ascoidea rubescens DSM 1968 TaxID=1344418 RepID=A0A1D2V8S0_9ASCO|nr:hypothetical protein ASCRUDRAFT_78305 [Ascoidea rubescens DSM 1968]ODV57895.1 hypothetical protein ASCRUDRAFT_78305 [Ascoidea rubescens DSM 1968]